nr:MAG TPA_asm: hypothetical protein [Caudoviricetes sp.]
MMMNQPGNKLINLRVIADSVEPFLTSFFPGLSDFFFIQDELILVAGNNPFVTYFNTDTHLNAPVMFVFEFRDLLTGHAKCHARNRYAASFRDWCVTFFADETRGRSDTAARVADVALAVFLLALLC